MKTALRALALPLLLIVIAEINMAMATYQSDTLAAPSAIVIAFFNAAQTGLLFDAVRQTLGAALGGLAIGGGLGVAVGILLGLARPLARLSVLTIELLRPIPAVAIMPLAMLVLGFGYRFEMSVVAFACFWPVMIITQGAIAALDPRLTEVSRSLGLNPLQHVGYIVLPSVVPRLFLAFRLAVGVALVVAVTVEIAANPQGLGYALMNAQETLKPALMFAFLFAIGFLGWAINQILVRTERRLFGNYMPAGATP